MPLKLTWWKRLPEKQEGLDRNQSAAPELTHLSIVEISLRYERGDTGSIPVGGSKTMEM